MFNILIDWWNGRKARAYKKDLVKTIQGIYVTDAESVFKILERKHNCTKMEIREDGTVEFTFSKNATVPEPHKVVVFPPQVVVL